MVQIGDRGLDLDWLIGDHRGPAGYEPFAFVVVALLAVIIQHIAAVAGVDGVLQVLSGSPVGVDGEAAADHVRVVVPVVQALTAVELVVWHARVEVSAGQSELLVVKGDLIGELERADVPLQLRVVKVAGHARDVT